VGLDYLVDELDVVISVFLGFHLVVEADVLLLLDV
jgi:hypothetical protein